MFLRKLRQDGASLSTTGSVELEVRIGLLVRQDLALPQRAVAHAAGKRPVLVSPEDRARYKIKFQPGLSEGDYKELEARMKNAGLPCTPSETVAYVMPNQERVIQEGDSFHKETKAKIPVTGGGNPNTNHCMDIMLPSCQYDIRIAAVVEQAIEYQGGMPTDFLSKRIKHRKTWAHPENSWQADFTVVDVKDQHCSSAQRLYEIELELKQPATSTVVQGIDQNVNKHLFDFLFNAPFCLTPFERIGKSDLRQVNDQEVSNTVRKMCSGVGTLSDGFPGANPVALRRSHINDIQVCKLCCRHSSPALRGNSTWSRRRQTECGTS